MAQYDITLGGTTVIQAEYKDPGGDWGGVRLTITSAKYNNSTNQLDLGYSVVLYPPKSSGRTDLTAVYATIGGEQACYLHANSGSTLVPYNDSEYRAGSKTMATGTVSIDASNGTTQSISLYIKGMFYWTWNGDGAGSRWAENTGCTNNSGTATAPVPGYPTISVSISSSSAATSRGGSNGSATATASASAGTNGGSITSTSVTNNGGGATATGLKNNTTYYYSASTTNSYGLTASTGSKSYYLTPIKPALSASASPARTTCTISLSPTYDTNRKFGSYSVSYGTSTNYGSTATSGSLSELTPNTTYYYSATVTDANNGGPYTSALTSDAATGSFTTSGDAPSISSVSANAARQTASLSVSASCDTNASVASYSVRYGTTTSYGSTSSSTSLSGLTPNTKYYYSVTVTDTWGRTSSAYTGNFTTTGNAPVINSVSKSESRQGCTLTPNVTYDTNAAYSSISIRYGTTTSYGSVSSSSSITGLNPDTKYYYSMTVTDTKSRTSAAYTGDFTTTGNNPTITLGTVTPGVFDCSIAYTASFDTNASFSYVKVDYGTTTSYGSSATSNTNNGSITLTSLSPNTLYYFRVTVYDNKSRSASTSRSSFTTLTDQAKARIKTASGWKEGV